MGEQDPITGALHKIYFDPENPAAYSGVKNIYDEARNLFPNLKLSDVKSFLSTQRTYTLHKPVRRRFPRNKVVSAGIDTHWQADLCDMQNIKQYNEDNGYILTVIDILSKYGWAEPVKRKTPELVAKAFLKILAEGRKPWYLYTDQGLEFLGKGFQKILKKYSIHHYTSKDKDVKAPNVERFNRTLKTRLWKYFTEKKTFKWLNILPLLTKGINYSINRTIGMRPIDVNESNDQMIWKKLHGNKFSQRTRKARFAVGDKVRITKYKTVFDKGYLPNFSEEIFSVVKIIKRTPSVYVIKDYSGEEVDGIFYEHELVKVVSPKDDIYYIEKILRKRNGRNGKKQILVKWKGYPEKFNQWINEIDIVNYDNY